jgi:hypothetical protein
MRSLSFIVPLIALPALSLVGGACSKMDPAECTKLRDGAYVLINQANNCSTDADCRPTEWPGCQKPVSGENFAKIHGMMESFQKGKCEEKPTKCQEVPKTYCAEGICAFRYKGQPGEGMRLE